MTQRSFLRYWPQWILATLAITVVVSALAGYRDASNYSWQELKEKRREVLRKIPVNPDILINITYDLMPGTPELTALGRKATPALVKGLLDNASDSVRGLCASVLAETRDPDAAPASLRPWEIDLRLSGTAPSTDWATSLCRSTASISWLESTTPRRTATSSRQPSTPLERWDIRQP